MTRALSRRVQVNPATEFTIIPQDMNLPVKLCKLPTSETPEEPAAQFDQVLQEGSILFAGALKRLAAK